MGITGITHHGEKAGIQVFPPVFGKDFTDSHASIYSGCFMDITMSIVTMVLVVLIALFVMTHWENEKFKARLDELMEKDFRGELTPEEQEEFQDMLNG